MFNYFVIKSYFEHHYSRWCNPCRMLTPRIETVVAEKQGKILLAKVDIDENTDLALDYHVSFSEHIIYICLTLPVAL